MNLLVVTGIGNSSWLPIYAVLNTSIKKIIDIIPDYADRIHRFFKQKKTVTVTSINEALNTQEDISYIFCDENQIFNLTQWSSLPQVKIVVFYSSPITALANALSQQQLTLDECFVFIDLWAEQADGAFRFYQQNKDICLLLDSDEVNKYTKRASDLISNFVGKDIKLGDVASNTSPESVNAANLILSERDDLNEIYDQIRSSAPIFENFKLSGYVDNQGLANEALTALQCYQKRTAKLNQQMLKLKNDNKQFECKLNEREINLQQNVTQLVAFQEALKSSEAKIKSSQTAHNETYKKHQTEIAEAQEEEVSLSNNVEQLTKKLTETETSLQQKVTQLNSSQETLKISKDKIASTQIALDETNKKYQSEIIVAQEEKLALSNNVEELTKKLTETESSLQQKTSQLVSGQEALKSSEAKVASSQAALEESNNKYQAETTLLKHDLNTRNAESTKLKQTYVDTQSENELLILQTVQLQEELEITLVQGKIELQQHTKKLTETESSLQQKTSQLVSGQEALKSSEAKVASSQAALEESNNKYQAETTLLKHDLNTRNAESTKLKQTYVDTQSENELLILQTVQLQEELESTFSQGINNLQKLTQDKDKSDDQLKEKLVIEKNLLQQISKLQEKVDTQKVKLSELTSKNEMFYKQQQLGKKDNEMKEAEVALQLSKISTENDLSVLQINQLQEEIEELYITKQQLSNQQNEKNQLLDKQTQTQQQMQTIQAENEIGMLQINQLQEELEFYYQQLQEKESKILPYQLANGQTCHHIYEQSKFGTFEIQGGYEKDGYQDIHLLLSDVQLADGRQFSKLSVKLIEVDGRPGVEFRPTDKTDESALLQWREDMQDEYGYFICFIPSPNTMQLESQQKTNEGLCASDRLLILSVASKLADIFQMTTDSDLPDGKLRDWKLIAIKLKSQVAKIPSWMSFDALSLVEEMRADNYEHLWLRFNNLLLNDNLRPDFEVKFAATDLTGSGEVFSNNIMLEIRQQANQHSPLQAWPPLSQDEYGYKLQVFVNLTEDELNIRVEEKLSDSDYQFIHHLVKNMVCFLQVLVDQGQNLERPIQDWLAIANRITQISEVNPEIEQDLIVSEEDEKNSVTLKFKPVFNEHVDLGGYQHLLYKQVLPSNRELFIKIRAENINLQTKTSELYLELRTGDDQVPLSDSVYFDEDEFGPRVLLPLVILQGDLLNQQIETPEMKLINMFSENMLNLIDSNSELDETQRELWQAMLRRDLWQAMLKNK